MRNGDGVKRTRLLSGAPGLLVCTYDSEEDMYGSRSMTPLSGISRSRDGSAAAVRGNVLRLAASTVLRIRAGPGMKLSLSWIPEMLRRVDAVGVMATMVACQHVSKLGRPASHAYEAAGLAVKW